LPAESLERCSSLKLYCGRLRDFMGLDGVELISKLRQIITDQLSIREDFDDDAEFVRDLGVD